MKVRITEYLEIDVEREKWVCERCGQLLIDARENYKKGCLVAEKPFEEVHPPMVEGHAYSFSPDPEYACLLEFYCPGCGVMIENEYLPPGHPITHDIQLDIDALKKRQGDREGISEKLLEAIVRKSVQETAQRVAGGETITSVTEKVVKETIDALKDLGV
jgi:acetophenone carboxylase